MVDAVDRRIALILVLVGPAATLAISPMWNYEPINLIKVVTICSASFYCIALLLSNPKVTINQIEKNVLVFTLMFLLAMISTLIFSGAPINQQIWGVFGRSTGFLTYFSFLCLLLSASYVKKKDFYKSLVNSIVLTSIPMTTYCLIQVANLDPIGWSEKHPFGTLGNINFSSAFFGLSTICSLALIGERKYSKLLRFSLLVLIIIDLSIVVSTNSIQGLMMFVAGAGIQGFIALQRRFQSKLLSVTYILIGLFASLITVLGLANKGPLSKFLFAPSIVFRTDYWHAGWAMTLKFPFIGVGLDSYGDWYRTLRGEISTLRTGPDRISNTAHNIFLDLSSNGGLPLILTYLALLVIAFKNGMSILRNKPSQHYVALFTSWIGFLIFSSISIAQVGVSIWGWLFTGALLGIKGIHDSVDAKIELGNKAKIKRVKRVRTKVLSPRISLIGILGFLVGLFLSCIPLQADAKFKNAMNSKAMDQIMNTLKTPGSTAFHQEIALTLAFNNNLTNQAKTIADDLVHTYPRDFTGWQAIYTSSLSTEAEKANALRMLIKMDPYNPSLR